MSLTWNKPHYNVKGVSADNGVSIAAFNDKLFMVWRGANKDQKLYYNTFDGCYWTPPAMVPGTATADIPRIAVFGGKLHMVWRGCDNDETIWTTSFDPNTNTWAPQQPIPNRSSIHSPGLAAFNNKLYMVWQESNPAILGTWSSSFDGTNWSNGIELRNEIQAAPAIVAYKNRLYATWTDSDHKIWVSSVAAGTSWSTPIAIPVVATNATPALTVYRDLLYAVYTSGKGTGGIWYTASADGINFGLGGSSDEVLPQGCTSSYPPSIAAFNGYLFVAWAADSKAVWYTQVAD